MADLTTLEEVATELSALRDLFQRRLLEDKAKARLYDELYAQTTFARGELAGKYLRPLYGELLLIIDRLTPLSDEPIAGSVVEELEEVLARRGVRRIVGPAEFDPRYHEAVRSEASADHPRGALLSELRVGYLLDDDLLRPASVVVSSGPPSASEESGLHEPGIDSVQDSHG